MLFANPVLRLVRFHEKPFFHAKTQRRQENQNPALVFAFSLFLFDFALPMLFANPVLRLVRFHEKTLLSRQDAKTPRKPKPISCFCFPLFSFAVLRLGVKQGSGVCSSRQFPRNAKKECRALVHFSFGPYP